MFFNLFIPTVEDYALELESDNINSHVNYLIMNLVNIINNGLISGSVELNYDMPSTLGDYYYTVYFSDEELCTIINGLSINKCINIDYEDISYEGVFISGGDLKLTIDKTISGTNLVMSN